MSINTYRLNTANFHKWGTKEWQHRERKRREHVQQLLIYLLNKSYQVVLKYWPSDFELPQGHYVSTFGVKKLLPYAVKVNQISPYGMEELICNVTSQTIKIILSDIDQGGDKIVPWYHMELLDEKGMILLMMADHGEDVVMNLSDEDLKALKEIIDLNMLLAVEEATKQL